MLSFSCLLLYVYRMAKCPFCGHNYLFQRYSYRSIGVPKTEYSRLIFGQDKIICCVCKKNIEN